MNHSAVQELRRPCRRLHARTSDRNAALSRRSYSVSGAVMQPLPDCSLRECTLSTRGIPGVANQDGGFNARQLGAETLNSGGLTSNSSYICPHPRHSDPLPFCIPKIPPSVPL